MSAPELPGDGPWTTPPGGGRTRVYHTREECPYLAISEHIREIAPDEVEAWRLDECQTCRNGRDDCGGAGRQIDCPHCGKTTQKLGNHIPCDGGEQ